MRILTRLLIFWALTAPISYFFVLPYALDNLSQKTQKQAHDQCVEQLRGQHMIGEPNSPITPQQGDHYCHCVSDHLQVESGDLIYAVKHQAPPGLTARALAQSEQCNEEIQRQLRTISSSTAPAVPANSPGETTDANGVIHF